MACAQIAPEIGAPERNRRLTADVIGDAAAMGARLIVLPELATSGYVFDSADEARSLAEPAGGVSLAAWQKSALKTGAVVVGGFCELGQDGHLYNSSAVVDATGVLAVYRKIHLWDREQLVFRPGSRMAPVVQTPVGRVGLAICYDLEFPELTRSLGLAGAEILCVPANWPHELRAEDEHPMMITLAAATARLNRVFFALCDRCGAERGVQWEGGSAIADELGRVLAGPVRDGGPAILTAECALDRAHDKSWNARNGIVADRRPELYWYALGETARG